MSHYIFNGRLCGYICAECDEPLANLEIHLYRVNTRHDVAALAAANPKETFALLDDDQVQEKFPRLLAKTTTNAEGNFTFKLDENYAGEAFELDVYCASVPRQKIGKKPPKPRHFTITTLQPVYKQTEDGLIAVWNYCLPYRFWCAILARFDVWTICGRIVDCKTKIPISDLKVRAFDADWLQDDDLGFATTDAEGKFVITYAGADFRRGTWLDVELIGGPDLYFTIEDAGGHKLLTETQVDGRTPGRQNVGNCFCVELCVPSGSTGSQPIPAFLKIGGIDYQTGMHSAPFGNGLTNSNYAFFSTLRLNGILSRTLNSQPMEYCYEYTKDFDGAGLPINWMRVKGSQISQTNIGYIEKANLVTLPLPHYVYNNHNVFVNGAPPLPGDIIITPDAQGWILVPQNSDDPVNPVGAGLFVANGNQIMLDSSSLMPFPQIDLTGLVAGQDTTSTGKPLANDEIIALRMLVRQQGNDATKVEAGMCNRLAIDNTLYNGMQHHSEWGAWGPVTEYGVCMVDIQQLQMAGCAKITTQVDILYSVAHPNLGSIGLTLTGPTPTVTLGPVPVSTNAFGKITHNFGANDPLCAYLVTLTATYLLTTGDQNLTSFQDQIAFCR